MKYKLTLYISEGSPGSQQALQAIETLLEEHLLPCDLTVIDVQKNPEAAEKDLIMAIPTLIKKAPKPPVRLVGNMTDKAKLVKELGIRPKEPKS